MEEDPVITIDDVAACGLCARGTRRWFESHDLSFPKFLREGAPASLLLATGDAFARRVVERKKAAVR